MSYLTSEQPSGIERTAKISQQCHWQTRNWVVATEVWIPNQYNFNNVCSNSSLHRVTQLWIQPQVNNKSEKILKTATQITFLHNSRTNIDTTGYNKAYDNELVYISGPQQCRVNFHTWRKYIF